jgi:hypothetical protein
MDANHICTTLSRVIGARHDECIRVVLDQGSGNQTVDTLTV